MGKIISLKESFSLAGDLLKKRKSIVLTGGCFDILHPGHIALLKSAKKQGDFLFVLLENDTKIKQLKGLSRPIFSQKKRAETISSLLFVDYVILLPFLKNNEDYDAVICNLKPTIIAITKNDPRKEDKERQAKLIGGKVLEVTDYLPKFATSKIINALEQEI